MSQKKRAPDPNLFQLHAVPRGPDRRGIRRGVSLLPSLFTLANLFCGWACVVHAMRGEIATAAPFIGVAIVLDMLDGRIARMTGTSSEFGVQLDSLADLISFGMAPAVLAFQWGLLPLGGSDTSGDGFLLSGRDGDLPVGVPRAPGGDHPRAADGEHAALPELQDL